MQKKEAKPEVKAKERSRSKQKKTDTEMKGMGKLKDTNGAKCHGAEMHG